MNNLESTIVFAGNIMEYFFRPLDSLVEKLPIVDFAKDALIDTLHMVPFLLVIFILIEYLEYFFGQTMNEKIKTSAKAGPLVGSLFGCVPQCGFSVIASTLYTRKFLTIGTLLAVYISTSDEAIPVILANPSKINLVINLLLTKIFIAVIAGYLIDLALKNPKNEESKAENASCCEHHCDCTAEAEETTERSSEGCCGHHLNLEKNKLELLTHPVKHTAKITLFILLVTLAINYIVFKVGGEENLGKLLLQHTVFQPLITAFIGLIPNCAASVAITLMYLKGGIGYGSMISGLCSSAGLGILVLLKENKDLKDTVKILSLLLGISVFSGLIIQFFYN